MNDKRIDLHVHSNCSDGRLSPGELVAYAAEKKLAAMALTDHDTIAGIPEAMEAAKSYDLELIPGLEFSTNYNGKDIHILGLDIAWQDPDFIRDLKNFQDSRDIRNRKMIALMQEHGVDITYEKMAAENPDSVWTRANFARYLGIERDDDEPSPDTIIGCADARQMVGVKHQRVARLEGKRVLVLLFCKDIVGGAELLDGRVVQSGTLLHLCCNEQTLALDLSHFRLDVAAASDSQRICRDVAGV